MVTYNNVSPLQARKDALFVDDQSQDRATGQYAVTNATIAIRISITRIVCTGIYPGSHIGTPGLGLVLDL